MATFLEILLTNLQFQWQLHWWPHLQIWLSLFPTTITPNTSRLHVSLISQTSTGPVEIQQLLQLPIETLTYLSMNMITTVFPRNHCYPSEFVDPTPISCKWILEKLALTEQFQSNPLLQTVATFPPLLSLEK